MAKKIKEVTNGYFNPTSIPQAIQQKRIEERLKQELNWLRKQI